MTLLVALDLTERAVLVVGAGLVGLRRAKSLAEAGARVTVVDPAPGAEADLAEQQGQFVLLRRRVQASDLAGQWLVVAATDDLVVNASVAGWALERGLWCINASEAGQGSARIAATGVHDELAIGVVSTGAPDPARSAAVRDALVGLLAVGAVPAQRRRRHRPVADFPAPGVDLSRDSHPSRWRADGGSR